MVGNARGRAGQGGAGPVGEAGQGGSGRGEGAACHQWSSRVESQMLASWLDQLATRCVCIKT